MGMQLKSEDLTLEIEDLTRNMVDFTGRIEALKKMRISLKGNWKTIPSDQTWLENPRSHGLVSCWERNIEASGWMSGHVPGKSPKATVPWSVGSSKWLPSGNLT